MKKEHVRILVFAGLIAFILIANLISVSAADSSSIPGVGNVEKVGEASEKITQTTKDLETQRLDFLFSRWRAFLLKQPAIAKLDFIMSSINPVFVVLFASDYSLSINLFFVILIWAATLLVFYNYTSAIPFLKETWQKLLFSTAITIMFAHLQIFNSVSVFAVNLLFKPVKWYWSVLIFFAIIMFIVVYYYVNNLLADYLMEKKKSRKEQELKEEKEETEAFVKAATKDKK